jgi:predicted alpha/beta-fold hydrolase
VFRFDEIFKLIIMKKTILFTVLLFAMSHITNAQYDDKFYFPTEEMKQVDWDNIKEFNFNVEQDSIYGLMLIPKIDVKASIIFFHGAGGNISTYYSIIYPLVEDGYQVFMFEPRGYGYSTGTPTHINIAHDAQIVLNSLIENESFDAKPLIIMGASMGTQIATKIANDNSKLVDALVLDGPMSSFTDIALESAKGPMKKIIKTYVTSPYSAKEQIKDLVGMPKLIIHSSNDESIPYNHGQIVFENAPNPKIFWNNEVGHLKGIIDKKDEYLSKMEYLIEQTN